MTIKTIGQLRKLIENLEDDFQIKIQMESDVPFEPELVDLEYCDTGYSQKVISFDIKKII